MAKPRRQTSTPTQLTGRAARGKPIKGLPGFPPGWGAQNLRVTLFHDGKFEATGELWKQLFGGELKQVNFDPVFSAIGVSDGAIVILSAAMQRIDLVATPLEADPPSPPQDQVIIDPNGVALRLLEVASKLSSRTSGVSRLAVAGVFRRKVSSREEGYQLLPSYLPFLTDLDASRYSDFNLQINSPKDLPKGDSGEPIRINRVTRWSVMYSQTVSMTLGASVSTNSSIPREHALRVELDLNTPAAVKLAARGTRLDYLGRSILAELSAMLSTGLALPSTTG